MGQVAGHLGETLTAERSSFDSRSDFATLTVTLRVSEDGMDSSPVSLKTRRAALNRASRMYFRLYGSKSFELASANNLEFSGRILDGTVRLVLTSSLCNVRQKRDVEHCADDKLSVKDMKDTVPLVPDLLRTSRS